MKIIVTESMFHDAFKRYGREANFSYEGRSALLRWLEEYEEASGKETELDVIALCCDFAEDTFENIASENDIDIEGMDEAELQAETLQYLEENTTVVWHDDERVLYENF